MNFNHTINEIFFVFFLSHDEEQNFPRVSDFNLWMSMVLDNALNIEKLRNLVNIGNTYLQIQGTLTPN